MSATTRVARTLPSKVFVAGAGAIGLRTALELSRRNVQVVVRAPVHPVQESCSMVAGGLWMPFHCDDARVDKWATETLDELLALEQIRPVNNEKPLVEIVSAIQLLRKNHGPDLEALVAMDDKKPNSGSHFPIWTQDPRLKFQHMSVEMLSWQNIVNGLKIPTESQLKQAGYLHAWLFRTPIVDTPAMLQYFLDELANDDRADVNVETGERFKSLSHLKETAQNLGCDMVVNCTGMGARSLVPDPKLIPARGVLLHFERQTLVRRPEILDNPTFPGGKNIHDPVITCEEGPWGSTTHPIYTIPRGDTVVVGGTYLEGDEETNVRPQERERLLRNAQLLGIDTAASVMKGEAVGFRPFRSPVRCEFDQDWSSPRDDIPVFHSYGYGGSGWTVNVGAAKECANQILATSAP